MKFELESLDIPLQWLFDEAMKRKRADDEINGQQRNAEYFRGVIFKIFIYFASFIFCAFV